MSPKRPTDPLKTISAASKRAEEQAQKLREMASELERTTDLMDRTALELETLSDLLHDASNPE